MTIILVGTKHAHMLPGELNALDTVLNIPFPIAYVETMPETPEQHSEECHRIGEEDPVMVLLPTNFDPALPSEALKHFRHIQICGTDVRELCEVSPALQYKPFEP